MEFVAPEIGWAALDHWQVIGRLLVAVTVKVAVWPAVTDWLCGCVVMVGGWLPGERTSTLNSVNLNAVPVCVRFTARMPKVSNASTRLLVSDAVAETRKPLEPVKVVVISIELVLRVAENTNV